jgi:hypothetical protein
VVLYAQGREPHRYDGEEAIPFDPAAGEPAGDVRGAPAYWLPEPLFAGSEPGGGLVWQWTPGAWVLVGAQPNPGSEDPSSTVDPSDLRAIATEVAPALTLGTCRPVTSPFAMPVPNSTHLVMAALMHQTGEDGTPYGVFLLGFDTADRPGLVVPPSTYEPSLTVFAETPAPPRDDALTQYSEDLGYPAYVDDQGALTLYDVSGLAINILPSDLPGATTPEERAGLAADIFPTITVYPGAAESDSNWGDPIVPDAAVGQI